MSADFIFRILGMIGFAIGGVFWGKSLGELANANPTASTMTVDQYAFVIGSVGALVGLILTPYITTRPARAMKKLLTRLSAQILVSALIGLIAGLIVAALFSFPISLLPPPFGHILPFIAVIIFGYLGIALFVMRQSDIFSIFSAIRSGGAIPAREGSPNWAEDRSILLDTSVIIDGRIADITRTGFLPGSLLIPRFVLNELQYIADSPDSMRRQRGRRGMEVLSALQKDASTQVRISDIDVEGMREVDDKLVVLARQLRCPILTNDYNLNRVAELQGVTVLNINELANAVKSVLLPGELMNVKVIQEGRESNQGVAYLDDGTMVVVENGRDYMDKEITLMVTKVLQTAAGRMIFGRPEEPNTASH
jgi:uncharacterized protein YacL